MTNKEAIKIIQYGLIDGNYPVVRNVGEEVLNMAIKALEERPQGEWIDDNNDSYYANCSCCGYQIDTHYERGYLNFCPNCGADMRGEQNEKT